MKRIGLVVLVGSSLASCQLRGVPGSGTSASDVRTVGAFQSLAVDGAFDTEVTIGGAQRVEITGDDNIVPLVTTELAGSALKLDTTKRVRPKLPLTARITAGQLTAVDLDGSGTIKVHGVHDDKLHVGLSGSGDVRADGTVRELDVVMSGSGKIVLDQLPAEVVHVTLSGSGDITVAASQTLAVSLSGSGTVRYLGSPKVSQAVSGSGSVVKQ